MRFMILVNANEDTEAGSCPRRSPYGSDRARASPNATRTAVKAVLTSFRPMCFPPRDLK
jgi:hypothetical protein